MQFPHRAQSAFMRLRSAPGGGRALRPFGPNALLATIPAAAAGTKDIIFLGGKAMKKYVCKVCGYVYDPAENNDVPFEELRDDWTCPYCGVGKDQFEECE